MASALTMGLHRTQLISAMGIALIAVFWAYEGWVYITWVAGEVKEPAPQCSAGHSAGSACGRRALHGDERHLSLRATARRDGAA